ncbi:MAG: MBL fold metallo-hydrolase [Deltaproteobacteria bacterium]|nr:MBL fold metallo-hydrolase [Deltaproteobacteria bacterium]MBI2975227.1 MBL fold metallo-hydrolase [Deltaproteobacteria bacterium]
MQIGGYKLSSIVAGEFALDGGAMFGVVPKVLWQKKIPADDNNRIPLSLRCLLIQGEGRNILVDDGAGDKYNDKLSGIYKIKVGCSLEESLKDKGLEANDITDVILTHLHFDHAGGSTKRAGNGGIVPAFPNAKYYLQRGQLERARNPSERDDASFFPEDFEPLIKSGQLNVLNGAADIAKGLSVQVTFGHTDSEQHPFLTDGRETLFYCGDLIPTSAHIGLPWIMAYDLRPLVTLEEKRHLLNKAADGKWRLFFEHCPFFAAARVKKTENGFEVYDAKENI